MSRYRMDDGTVVDTRNATRSWDEAVRWDGHNNVSVVTGSQWEHETLHRSRRGRYWIERTSQWQGSSPSAEWVSNRTAASWLMTCGHDVPEELAQIADEMSE